MKKRYELKVYLCNGGFVVEDLPAEMFPFKRMSECRPVAFKWLCENQPLWRMAVLVIHGVDFAKREYSNRCIIERE